LFVTVGILSYKYGLNNPLMLMIMVFAVVFFLDVGVGIIPDISVLNGKIFPHLLTFITGLILAIMVIKEVSTRWWS